MFSNKNAGTRTSRGFQQKIDLKYSMRNIASYPGQRRKFVGTNLMQDQSGDRNSELCLSNSIVREKEFASDYHFTLDYFYFYKLLDRGSLDCT